MVELERELRELGATLALPEPPDLAGGVARRLRAEPRRGARRRGLALALAAGAGALAAALAVPPVRAALLDVLELAGVRIERVEKLPPVSPNAPLAPGDPVSRAEARDAVSFSLTEPAERDLCRECGTVLLDRTIPGGRVTFVWPARRPRLFLMQFRGEALPYVQKSAGPGTTVEQVDVAGAPGTWLGGARHAVAFRDARGRILFGRRLAGNVLVWERAGVTFRLESDLPLERALAIARRVR